MITQTTINNLKKKADRNYKEEAVARLQMHYDRYRDALAETKKIKLPSGYVSSSERDMHSKRKFRNENTINTLKKFLNEVGEHKSNPAIYLYIQHGPTGSVDYYHGASTSFMPFRGSEWKRIMTINIFKGKLP